MLFSTVAAPVCIPTNTVLGFTLSAPPPAVVSLFINHGHSDRCQMISHCGFNLHLFDGQ